MSDLISRSKVIAVLEQLEEHSLSGKMDISNAIYLLEIQPTAYDISKGVAELEVMEEKRVRFAKQILDYWDKQGTQQTILFLKDIVENSEVQNERIYRKAD